MRDAACRAATICDGVGDGDGDGVARLVVSDFNWRNKRRREGEIKEPPLWRSATCKEKKREGGMAIRSIGKADMHKIQCMPKAEAERTD